MGFREAKYPTGLLGGLCLMLALVAHDIGSDRWFAYLLAAGVLLLGTAAGLYWLERDMARHLARHFGTPVGRDRWQGTGSTNA
ncbi:hypothetical protein [Streptomyces sp. IBSNAI001]|uniref:hypothetical protein n=1 Tax=Streptomyces sp. IBSNAI001 TaxID=3457499 RepID=UPI003FD5A3F1